MAAIHGPMYCQGCGSYGDTTLCYKCKDEMMRYVESTKETFDYHMRNDALRSAGKLDSPMSGRMRDLEAVNKALEAANKDLKSSITELKEFAQEEMAKADEIADYIAGNPGFNGTSKAIQAAIRDGNKHLGKLMYDMQEHCMAALEDNK